MAKFKKVSNILATVLLVLMTLLVVFVFIQRLTGKAPKMFGYQLFNVVTDSMVPKLNVGDVILVNECNPETDIHKGDIISYHGKTGDFAGKDITHMVVKEPEKNESGVLMLQTQGLKTGAALDPQIEENQVIGKYVMKLRLMSFIYGIFRKWYGLLIFVVILIALMGKELFSLRKIMNGAEEKLTQSADENSKEINDKK